VAKAIALGADLVGVAGPFLRAAAQGEEAACLLAEEMIEVLRTVMFCVGAPTIPALQHTPRLVGDGERSMHTFTRTLDYDTTEAPAFLDITDDVAAIVRQSGIRGGMVQICSAHTTAAIRINEAEPLLLSDFRRFLNRIAPDGEYEHDDMSRRVGVAPDEPVNGRAHCQHLLLSSSETVPLVEGKMRLGQYQRIFLVELCSPRPRQVIVQVLGH
jgi:secondary thiamine-phosphate synthase enzyme